MMIRILAALVLAVLTLPALPAPVQDLHSVSGKVTDAKGVPVPAATVRIFAGGSGPPLEVLTDLDGLFQFANLPAGSYRLEVEMQGFERLVREGLKPGDASTRDLVIKLERARAMIPARPAAQRGPQPGNNAAAFQEVDLSGLFGADPGIGSALGGGNAVREDPAGGSRPFGTLQDNTDMLLISGNAGAGFDAGMWDRPDFQDRIRDLGDRLGFGGFALMGPMGGGEGGPGAGFPEMMGGRGGGPGGGRGGGPGGGPGGGGRGGMMGGGPGIMIGGRGFGGRQPIISGSLTESYRNSALNARPYSITGKELDRPLQIQNSFGLSLGGPLPFGRAAASRARRGMQGGRGGGGRGGGGSSWFFSYEGSRNRNPYDGLTTVPTELERSGDFSRTMVSKGAQAGQLVRLYDPATRLPFPGNAIPASRQSAAARALLAYLPLPNLPGTVQNYTQQRGLLNTGDSFSVRFGLPVASRLSTNVSYSYRTGDSVSSQIFPGLDTDRTTRGQNVGLNGMLRLQPRLIVNMRFQYNRSRTLSGNRFSFADDVAGRLGIAGVSREPINYGIPTINFTNYGDLQLGNPSLNRTNTYTAGAGINRIGTKHTISAGWQFTWNQRNSQVDPNARGTFNFTGFATSALNPQGFALPGTGLDFADFLLGLPYSTSRRYGSNNNYLRNRDLALYVQDNWRARGNLTFSLGVRYEYNGPYFERNGRMVSLDVAPGFTAVQQVFPGMAGPWSGTFPRGLIEGDRNNLAPRIGLAWKRKAASKWTLRTGYGISYNPSVFSSIAGQLIGQPPFAVNQNTLTTAEAPLTLLNGFPINPDVTIRNSYAIDPHYRMGYVQQWNLSFQTQIKRLYSLEAGYSGSRGTRLDILRAPNRAPSGVAPDQTEDNRIIGNAESFTYQESGANAVMHSMELRLVRRFSTGVRMEGSYTLAKSIDNASGLGTGQLLVVQDDRNIAAERSLSSFDQRHRLRSNFSMDLPFGERRRYLTNVPPLLQAIVAGWTMAGNFTLASGSYLTARVLGNQANNSGSGSNFSERADATGLPVLLPRSERTTALWFNTQAFTTPQPGKYGNAGRATIPGPGSSQLNLTLRKSLRYGENNRRVDVGWNITNVLNHPNYGGLGTTVNSINFGRVTNVRGMRQMEFSLRVNF